MITEAPLVDAIPTETDYVQAAEVGGNARTSSSMESTEGGVIVLSRAVCGEESETGEAVARNPHIELHESGWRGMDSS